MFRFADRQSVHVARVVIVTLRQREQLFIPNTVHKDYSSRPLYSVPRARRGVWYQR